MHNQLGNVTIHNWESEFIYTGFLQMHNYINYISHIILFLIQSFIKLHNYCNKAHSVLS